MNDWSALITRGFESKDLDYKAPMAWDPANEKESCCKLVKDILALANSKGGWLVFGVSEPQKGQFDPVGLTEQQAASFETTRVNQFLQNYADPPINTTAVRAVHEGKLFIIIQVPAFPDTPHICQKDFPGVLAIATMYVRTDNNESAPLKSSSDFRIILEHAVRQRADTLLTSIRSILVEGVRPPEPSSEENFRREIEGARQRWTSLNPSPEHGPILEVVFSPSDWLEGRFDWETIRKMAFQGHVDYRGWPFLFISDTGCSDWTYRIEEGLETRDIQARGSLGHTWTFWRLNRSGLFYWKQNLRDVGLARPIWVSNREAAEDSPFLDFDGFSMSAGEIVNCLGRLYDGVLSDSESVELRLELNGLEGYLIGSSRGRDFRPHLCRVNEINVKMCHSLADWKAGLLSHAADLCGTVFGYFNWENPNLDQCKKVIGDMLARRI